MRLKKLHRNNANYANLRELRNLQAFVDSRQIVMENFLIKTENSYAIFAESSQSSGLHNYTENVNPSISVIWQQQSCCT